LEVVELSEPSVLFIDHEYVVPAGQVAVHDGVAVNGSVVPPESTVATLGEIVTEARVGDAETSITAGVTLILVMPLSVALTKRATTPALELAVNRTGLPDVELSEPMLVLFRFHR
jgi:hypothetical protein